MLTWDIWKWKSLSCVGLFATPWTHPWNSPGQNTRVGNRPFLQGTFPSQGLNPGLPHYRWFLYQLSHKGSPRTLQRVDSPFSRGSSRSKNWTGVSRIAGGFFTNWAIREVLGINFQTQAIVVAWGKALEITTQGYFSGLGQFWFGSFKYLSLNGLWTSCPFFKPFQDLWRHQTRV